MFAKSCDLEAVKIWQTCQRGDWLIWLLQKTNQLDKPQSVRVATCCAKHVLGMYEEKYPGDKRPSAAIAAAKAYLENPSEENRVAAYAAAASAAYAASHAADYSGGLSESKWQADKIRELIPCPFENSI